MYRRAKILIPGGTQLLSKRPEMFLPDQWPSYYERAEGACIWDLDGNKYIDMCISGVGACPLGYADPDVNAAVIDAVRRGSMSTLNCPEEVELAEVLCRLHPWAQMVRFARTGGESMSVAVRIARAWTGRSQVAFCGYHGWSDWYLAVNLVESDALGSKGLLLSGLEPRGVPRELTGTAWGFRHNHLEELRDIVSKTGGNLAAIITEPQRGERPTPEFLAGLRQIANETGAVLIFDEISAAMRLNTGGAHLLYGQSPDIAVFSKSIGNGFAIGAVIGKGEVMEAAQTTFLSSTYWTERVGPAAALATFRKHEALNVPERLIHAGRRVQQVWKDESQKAGLAAEASHPEMPPLSHLVFKYPNAKAVQTLLCQMMLERGFLDNGNFYAMYAHTDEILDQYEAVVREVFPLLADAVQRQRVEALLKGPVSHSGFARLTS